MQNHDGADHPSANDQQRGRSAAEGADAGAGSNSCYDGDGRFAAIIGILLGGLRRNDRRSYVGRVA